MTTVFTTVIACLAFAVLVFLLMPSVLDVEDEDMKKWGTKDDPNPRMRP